jgi:hypothetical protein
MDEEDKTFFHLMKNALEYWDELRIKHKNNTIKNDKYSSKPIPKSISQIPNKISVFDFNLKMNIYLRMEPIFLYTYNKKTKKPINIRWCWSIYSLPRNLIKYSLELFLYTLNLNNSYKYLKEIMINSVINFDENDNLHGIKYKIIIAFIAYFFKPYEMVEVQVHRFPDIKQFCDKNPLEEDFEYAIVAACYTE